ncbi:DUF983 domain-containing protein [Falsigemmobacter faecalis]|uniref:DUF983 domain-containing protein n=1 Tax=Falsigemmobacter faecalis TaxID=2488730 RepID=A0A3P3DRD0_9RHOB|nr:DUF983 domain-containing protein [Falsigemmobacter faecalis]RRH76236.1 DUF983 domain-containing protein [Falsigemmobacter faecalis]
MSERDTLKAILRGARSRCPNCGEGALFAGYLRKADRCSHCDEDFTRIRPADGPAFFVLCITCLLLIPAQIITFRAAGEHILTGLIVLSLIMTAITLVLLRPVKGAVIGLQWAGRDYQA